MHDIYKQVKGSWNLCFYAWNIQRLVSISFIIILKEIQCFAWKQNSKWTEIKNEAIKYCLRCWNVFKGVTTGDILPIGPSVLLPEFKLCSLKNLKLFSIRVKELFEPKPLRGEKKSRQVFALSESIFFRNGSLSNARWFYGKKKCKIRKGNVLFNWKSIR